MVLGSRVARADRVYGGYAPSATFRLKLADGKRAFFKASYPAPKGSGVRWFMDHEARNYRTLERFIRPWAPRFHGSFARDGWHVLLLEDLGPRSVPPWTSVSWPWGRTVMAHRMPTNQSSLFPPRFISETRSGEGATNDSLS